MDKRYVDIGCWVIAGILVLITLLAGLIRRFRSELFCFAAQLAAAAGALFLTPLLSSSLYSMFGEKLISLISESADGFEQAAELCGSVAELFIRSFLTPFLFFAVFLLLRLILGIPVLILRCSLKPAASGVMRSRLLGMLLGIVGGVLMTWCALLSTAGVRVKLEETVDAVTDTAALHLPEDSLEMLQDGIALADTKLFGLIDRFGGRFAYEKLAAAKAEDGTVFLWWEEAESILEASVTILDKDADAEEISRALLGSYSVRSVLPVFMRELGGAWIEGEDCMGIEPPDAPFKLDFLYERMKNTTEKTLKDDVDMVCGLFVVLRDADLMHDFYPEEDENDPGEEHPGQKDPTVPDVPAEEKSFQELLADEDFIGSVIDVISSNDSFPELVPEVVNSLLDQVTEEIDELPEGSLRADTEAYLKLSPQEKKEENELLTEVLQEAGRVMSGSGEDLEEYFQSEEFENLLERVENSVLCGSVLQEIMERLEE